MPKHKYVVIDTEAILPLGGAKNQALANDIGESTGGESFDILSDSDQLKKAYKVDEIVRLYNSVSDDPVLRFKNKAEAANEAWEALSNFDYENDTVEEKEGQPRKPGQRRSNSDLSTGVVELRDGTGEGWTRLNPTSLRAQLLEQLKGFMGRKKSVTVSDFRESVTDDRLVETFDATLRHLMRCGQVIVTVERDGEMVEWMKPDTRKRDAMEARQKEKAEKEAEKKAKEKAQKAKAKAEDDE